MTHDDQPRFFQALDTMAEFFHDDLSELRQRVYWESLCGYSIDAWEYACTQALRTHTYYRVPLPGELLPVIEGFEQFQRVLTTPLIDDTAQRERQRQEDRAKALRQIEQDEAILAEVKARRAEQQHGNR